MTTAPQDRAAEAALMARLPDGALMQRAAHALAVHCGQMLGSVYGSSLVFDVTCPSGVLSNSPLPERVIVLASPPPEIDAFDGPFAAAVAGRRTTTASAAGTSMKRFIESSFR